MAKAYKMTLLVIDFDEYDEDQIVNDIENDKYKYLTIKVMNKKSILISDEDFEDHPFNDEEKNVDAFEKIFG